MQYDLLLSLPAQGYAINFKFPDSIAHFDVIENNNFDTISSSGSFDVHKKIIFTSFDSGSWHIPSFEVLIERNGRAQQFFTDSIKINVGYSPADSTGELRDIKPVMEVTVTDYFWYYVAGGVLLAIILGWLVYRYLKNRPKQPKPIFASALTPYDEAMKALQELKILDLNDPIKVKEYHSSLTALFKKYYSRKLDRNMVNKTTADILINVREQYEDGGLVSSLAEAMRCADAVKFAKFIPSVAESDQSHAQVKQAIELIEKLQSPPKQ